MGMEPINSISNVQAQTVGMTVTAAEGENMEGITADAAGMKTEEDTSAVSVLQEADGGQKEEAKAYTQEEHEKIKKAVESLNRNLNSAEAVFGVHEKTNRVMIKIVDKETKEVIKELPPEKTLNMIAKVWELAGLLVDEKR